ncbi:MAG: hypothetical protein Q9188_004305 [Gyalolechia gomerana]
MHQQNAARQHPGFAAGLSHDPPPSRRIPLGNMSANSVNRSNYGGYGMSAGAKIGRQHGSYIELNARKMTVPMQRTSTYTSLELDFDIPAPTTSRFTMIRRASLRPWQLVSMLTPASSPADRPRSNSGGNSRDN